MFDAVAAYHEKNDYLSRWFEEVTPADFYRDIYPAGSFEREGHPEDGKANGLALVIQKDGRAYHRIVTDEQTQIPELIENDFVIMGGVAYCGQRRTAENARYLYAMIFDVDEVGNSQIQQVFDYLLDEWNPRPTYIVNSGGGIHEYFVFETPIPLYPHYQEYLRKVKQSLTRRIWTKYTSCRESAEYQSIMQGFRMVGSMSKLGKDYPVKAYKTGEKVTLDYLLHFIPTIEKKEWGSLSDFRQSSFSLEEAKRRFPEWYERRIENGGERGRWHIKRALYDWWLKRLPEEAENHHRYFCIMALAIYARKCDIPEDELRKDAYSLLPVLDRKTEEESNHFTRDDIEAALTMYAESFVTFPRDEIARLTNIFIKENRRNGRPQELHMKLMSAQRDVLYPNGTWRGNPSKEDEIRQYLIVNPSASKSEIQKNTGISYTTIRKYYDTIKAELVTED